MGGGGGGATYTGSGGGGSTGCSDNRQRTQVCAVGEFGSPQCGHSSAAVAARPTVPGSRRSDAPVCSPDGRITVLLAQNNGKSQFRQKSCELRLAASTVAISPHSGQVTRSPVGAIPSGPSSRGRSQAGGHRSGARRRSGTSNTVRRGQCDRCGGAEYSGRTLFDGPKWLARGSPPSVRNGFPAPPPLQLPAPAGCGAASPALTGKDAAVADDPAGCPAPELPPAVTAAAAADLTGKCRTRRADGRRAGRPHRRRTRVRLPRPGSAKLPAPGMGPP